MASKLVIQFCRDSVKIQLITGSTLDPRLLEIVMSIVWLRSVRQVIIRSLDIYPAIMNVKSEPPVYHHVENIIENSNESHISVRLEAVIKGSS